MLYKIMSIRISDSKDLKSAKIETRPMKNDQNGEKNQNFLKFAESFRNHSRIKKLLQKAFSE